MKISQMKLGFDDRKTINDNFAGTGIAKFVVGEAWNGALRSEKEIILKTSKDI